MIRCDSHWFAYEDGKLPERLETLTENMLCNSVMFWLYPATGVSGRLRAIDPAIDPDDMVDDDSDTAA